MHSSQIEQVAWAVIALAEEGKASFCIWIAVQVRDALKPEEAERVGISRAVELLQAWEAGKPVAGDELNELLMDANDEGLYAFVDPRQPNKTDTAIEVVGGAIGYVAWLAYRRAGQRLPDGINQVNDDAITWTVQQAIDSRAVTPQACLSAIEEFA